MNFTRDQLARILDVLDAEDLSFLHLIRVAKLRPERDLCGADLRRVDFGADDFGGFDFAGADIRGANLARARGLRADMFVNVCFDDTTRWPDGLREAVRGFDVEAAAHDLILAGHAPPASWRPYIQALDFSDPTLLWRLNVIPSHKIKTALNAKKFDKTFARADLLKDLISLRLLDLTGTEVSDIAPLAGLAALQSLNLMNTKVSDVAPLAGLAALQSLDLMNTQVSDVAPLAGLAALRSLHLMNTQVGDVAPLAGLTALQSLYLTGTRVSDVAPLARLTALKQLDLRGTRVRDISGLAHMDKTQIKWHEPPREKQPGKRRP